MRESLFRATDFMAMPPPGHDAAACHFACDFTKAAVSFTLAYKRYYDAAAEIMATYRLAITSYITFLCRYYLMAFIILLAPCRRAWAAEIFKSTGVRDVSKKGAYG